MPVSLETLVRNRVRQAREERHLLQVEAGKMVGVTGQGWGDWERGDTAISLDNLERIARALNKPLTYFVSDVITPNLPQEAGILFSRLTPYNQRVTMEIMQIFLTQEQASREQLAEIAQENT